MSSKRNIKIKDQNKQEKQKSFNLFSFGEYNMNYNSSWLDSIIWLIPIKVVLNIILIMEIAQSQLIVVNGFNSSQAMESHIHKHQAKIISLPEIMNLFIAVAVDNTNKFALAIRNSEVVTRFKEISEKKFMNNSKFKGIVPSVGMKPEILNKFTTGLAMHLRSSCQTHPLYGAVKVINHFGIEDIKNFSLDDIKKLSPFQDDFEPAIKFLQNKIQATNPFIMDNSNFELTKLYKELLYIVESSIDKNMELEIDAEDEEDMTDEE